MRVALLTDGIQPYVIGGMQKHSFYVAKYLALNKIEVELFHTQIGNKYDLSKLEVFSEEEKKYITSHVIDFPSLGSFPGHYLKESYEYSIRVFNKLKQIKPVDFIYAKGFSGWKSIEEKAKGYNFNAPIAVKFHGLNMFQKTPGFKGWLESILFKGPVKYNMLNADYVFSYGGRITDITKSVGVAKEKIIEVPTGIEANYIKQEQQIKKTGSVIKFLYVGRYERLKGVEELSESIKSIGGDKRVEFHFVGPIPSKKRISQSNVIYHGEISEKDKLLKIVDSCDVLICTSYSEGMPNVIIEAMSRGLGILATDVGAINYLVNDITGWLISSPDVRLLTEKINFIIRSSPQLIDEKKKQGILFAKQTLVWDKVAEQLISKIGSTINSWKQGGGNHP